jgi:hypothetical protein
MASTGARLVIFAVPAVWISRLPGFQLAHLWYLSVATVILQAILSYSLLQWQFTKRLDWGGVKAAE